MKTPVAKVASIDQYIRGFPEDVQITLSELRSSIRLAAPEATEKISYRMPTFYFNGNLVHFAAFAHHIGFYPTPSGIDACQQELKVFDFGSTSTTASASGRDPSGDSDTV